MSTLGRDRLPPLVVFADDWGRHPSSCQHLITQLLPEHRVIWVNTIMRPPRLDWATLRRGCEKLRQWGRGSSTAASRPSNLSVLNPRMWPWFSTSAQRRFNAWLLECQLRPVINDLSEQPVAITTLPIVADLIGRPPVQRWVYYCVDDFSEWPGLDGRTLRQMEEQLVKNVDEIVVVSETLRTRIAKMGRPSQLLTHGVDLEFWRTGGAMSRLPAIESLERPLVVFWGVVDRRMDLHFVRQLARSLSRGTIVLAGPIDQPDPELCQLPNVVAIGAIPYADLPSLARQAAVLIMPYADLPVTRAMQPLKLKEYLATGRPTVVRDLPSTTDWADCMDVVASSEDFAERVELRIQSGLPPDQKQARSRLVDESWSTKAELFSTMARLGFRNESLVEAH